MDVRGPDGKIVRFPDGTDAGKVNEVMSSIYAKPKAAPHASGTLGQLGRQVGLAARYVPEGLADLAGIVTNPINTAINTGLQAFGSKARIGTDLGQAASSTLDRIGLPKPSGGVERVVGDASRAVVGAAPFVGAGNVLARAASPVIRGVGQALAASPGAQAGYGALGGASAGTAREAGLPVPLQVAAGLGIPLGVNALGPRAVNAMRTMGQQASPKRAAEIARNVISDALTADNISPNLAGQVVSEANSRGVPLALMDVGPNTRGLASSLARKPGASRTMLTDATGPRQYSAGERIRGAVSRDLGPIENPFEAMGGLMKDAANKSAPLYRESFKGGSMAPLEKQFENTFNESSSAVNAAKRELNAALAGKTLARSKQSTAGMNVYGNSAANREAGSADSIVAAAQAKLENALTQHEGNLSRLRQAQADGTANAPGAVWSPRIQQFLDDPIAKAGLAKGLEVQRLEALAEGKPFDPTEYAIVGTAEDGSPVVGSVPNMRTLDAVKRGIDETLNAYPRAISGKLQLDQRGRAIEMVRKSLLGHLDELNPTYAKARAAYAGPAAARDAFANGRSSLNKTADEIEQMTSRLGDFERSQYASGLRTAMAEAIDKSGGSTDIVNKLLGSAAKRKALAKIFGGEAGLNNFIKTMADEKSAFETYRRISLGSPTAANLADDAMVQDGALSNTLAPAAANLLMGRPRAAIGNVLEGAKDAWRFGVGNTAQEARNQAAALLNDTNGSALRDVLAQAARQKAIEQVRRNAIRRTAIVSGSNTRR